ncbi:hypothetical protein [Halorussus litoreus]|uniref:hypothetical protein n=1 Tax=Halorussus litoreus TaxID=1710536 RepID=UPI000E284BA4|nr:hypothetical protein [Halorussus litoreus]
MNRRALLRRTSPLASLACLAGCLGSASRDPATGDRTERTTTIRAVETTASTSGTTTEPSETTRDDSDGSDDFSGIDPAAEDPFQSLAVGDRESVAFPDNNRPHDVRVWNDADESRELVVRVSRDATQLLDRTVEFDGDASLEVALNEPGDYQVAVGLAGEQPTTVRVERALFDCNASATDARVASDGRVETVTQSTMMGCAEPKVAAIELSVDEGTCGTENGASVSFDGEQVRVEGTVRTPDPGYDLELADANYDADSGELTVQVRATEGDPVGVQCVGEVPYEATVDFEYDLPGEVVVVHESGEESEEVARTSR